MNKDLSRFITKKYIKRLMDAKPGTKVLCHLPARFKGKIINIAYDLKEYKVQDADENYVSVGFENVKHKLFIKEKYICYDPKNKPQE